jgi:twitching motility protein PilJ
MGFAWKSMGFSPKGGDDNVGVLAAPDTEFGPEVTEASAAPDDHTDGFAHVQDAPTEGVSDLLGTGTGAGSGGGGNQLTRKDDTVDDGDSPMELPFIGHLSLGRQQRILMGVFAGGIVVIIAALAMNTADSIKASNQTQIASDALMHSQRIGKAAPNAIQGSDEAFTQLEESRVQLNKDLALMTNAAPSSMGKKLTAAKTKWISTDNSAGTILKMKPELTGFSKTLKQLDALTPELLSMTEELLNQKAVPRANWPPSAA